jgi:uncharacterized protein YeaO (DUF488 family)
VGAGAAAEYGTPEWFGHDPSRFEEFRRRYIERSFVANARGSPSSGGERAMAHSPSSNSARDTEHNDAVVLAEVLRRGLPKG